MTSFRGLADHSGVFIRRTQTRRAKDGSAYTTHRLVRSERRGGKVRQRTLLNLGRHFEIEPDAWPRLCARIEDLLDAQPGLLDDVPPAIEAEAQRIAALLLARRVGGAPGVGGDAVAVHPDSMELARPRGVGVEQVGLWAMERVGLMRLLEELGVNGALRAAAAGLIVGRLAHPGSERETHRWLRRDSALGELLGVDYEANAAVPGLRRWSSTATRSRRGCSSAPWTVRPLGHGHAVRPDQHLLRGRGGQAAAGAARIPRRSETLGLVLDGSGFSRSRVFAGNVREHTTLQGMLDGLRAPADALVVMDRGIATEAQIAWLRESATATWSSAASASAVRRRGRRSPPRPDTPASGAQGLKDSGEVRLNCYSEQRAQKERAMVGRRYEGGVDDARRGVQAPRAAQARTDQPTHRTAWPRT